VRSSSTSGTRKVKPRRSRKRELKSFDGNRLIPLEASLWNGGFRFVAGVDESGRGPLAGPVVAAAVVLKPDGIPPGIADSKKLSRDCRDRVFLSIVESAVSVSVGIVYPVIIDRMNILKATLLAMRRAIGSLSVVPDCVIVDGSGSPDIEIPVLALIKGDSRCASVAAASIVAKVVRDGIMDELDIVYPRYSFRTHRGYGTAAHLEALRIYGPSRIHRFSFQPVGRTLGVLDV
jgi:ribonuclease HII